MTVDNQMIVSSFNVFMYPIKQSKTFIRDCTKIKNNNCEPSLRWDL